MYMLSYVKRLAALCSALVVTVLLPFYAYADSSTYDSKIPVKFGTVELERAVCDMNVSIEKRIETWSIIMSEYITLSPEANDCFNFLSIEEQAVAFERMAERLGLLDELIAEADSNVATESPRPDAVLAQWNEMIEYNLANTSWHVSAYPNYYADGMCDGDPTDMDDVRFDYVFSSPVNTPWSLRSFVQGGPAPNNVAAMLAWYQVRDGGIASVGDTNSHVVRVCLGANGLFLAGGPWSVQQSMRLQR